MQMNKVDLCRVQTAPVIQWASTLKLSNILENLSPPVQLTDIEAIKKWYLMLPW